MFKIFAVFCFLFSAFFLTSCGIEDVPFIPPVPNGNITQEFNNRATIPLPNIFYGTPFTHFAIYYRIYVSDAVFSSTDRGVLTAINPQLATNFTFFDRYVDSEDHVNPQMHTTFEQRGYFPLQLAEDHISRVLSASALGSSIVIEFPSGRNPFMRIGTEEFTLLRNNGAGIFHPEPSDRLFFVNFDELWRPSNLVSGINRDVANLSGIADGTRRYTYVSMYIVAVGVNVATWTNIFSTPSFVHVFLLPDPR